MTDEEGREVLPPTMPRRDAELDVAAFDGEFVVFDLRTRHAHLLEGFDAIVFDACDGTTTSADFVDEVVAVLRDSSSDGPPDPAHVAVRTAASLRTFRDLGLLDGETGPTAPPCIGCGQFHRHHARRGLLGFLTGDRPPRQTANKRRN